jgi:hypothetical protein
LIFDRHKVEFGRYRVAILMICDFVADTWLTLKGPFTYVRAGVSRPHAAFSISLFYVCAFTYAAAFLRAFPARNQMGRFGKQNAGGVICACATAFGDWNSERKHPAKEERSRKMIQWRRLLNLYDSTRWGKKDTGPADFITRSQIAFEVMVGAILISYSL